MMIETDGDVIAASVDEPERFEVIFDRHAARIHRYLRRRVGAALAEDLTAETFMRALHARAQFDTSLASSLPWLYGIAVNLIRMNFRSEQRRERAYGRSELSVVEPSLAGEADARMDAQALAPVLRSALGELSIDEREVLLLHAWGGLGPGEIGQALGLPSVIVRKRLHRARAKAASHLERHDADSNNTVSQIRTAR